jgi:methylated-DNA-[protein]-cysteine S-methyltransferase
MPDFFMINIYKITIETPVGFLEIATDHHFLLSVSFVGNYQQHPDFQPDILKETVKQIREYFEGIRKEFNLNLKPSGTDFQIKVWEHVKNVSFGKTASYLELAKLTGSEKNSRAVGMANGKNPIPIIIPCHRIIGANGRLTGYAGGLDKKRWLLKHELEFSHNPKLLF